MKKTVSMFVGAALVLLWSATAFAQSDSTKCFVVLETGDYSFGAIDQDKPVEHTFVMKNNCSTTIEIDNARASCGCTAAVLSEKIIAPGKEAKIQVKFTPPKGTRGKVSKTVTVTLKGETQPHTVLRFSADVKSDLDIQPSYIQLLAAEVGKKNTSKVTVKNVTAEEIEITEAQISMTAYVDTAGDGKTVSIPENGAVVKPTTMKLKPNESADITIEVTPEHKGSINGSVRLKTKKNDAMVQVYGVVRGKDDAVAGQPKPAASNTGTVNTKASPTPDAKDNAVQKTKDSKKKK